MKNKKHWAWLLVLTTSIILLSGLFLTGVVGSKPNLTHIVNRLGLGNQNISEEDVEQEIAEMSEQAKRLYSDKPGGKSFSGLPDSVNGIVKSELIPCELFFKEDPRSTYGMSGEEIDFHRGKYFLKIAFDNGKISVTGPFKRFPSRVEIVQLKVNGKIKKGLIIED